MCRTQAGWRFVIDGGAIPDFGRLVGRERRRYFADAPRVQKKGTAWHDMSGTPLEF